MIGKMLKKFSVSLLIASPHAPRAKNPKCSAPAPLHYPVGGNLKKFQNLPKMAQKILQNCQIKKMGFLKTSQISKQAPKFFFYSTFR